MNYHTFDTERNPDILKMPLLLGIDTFGGYGSSERKEYTAMGMQVNIAASIQSACPPAQIMLDHTTWVFIKDEISF